MYLKTEGLDKKNMTPKSNGPKMEKANQVVRMLKMGQTIKSNGTY